MGYGGDLVRITLNNCNQEKTCEYIGIVTYRPYMSELLILTTPKFPMLNCPVGLENCVQEQIFVDKGNVKSLEKL